MSLTSTVPALVPSVFQSSRPAATVVAAKNPGELAEPSGNTIGLGSDPSAPGLMSLTNETTPALVTFHSSVPLTPLSAEKNSTPRAAAFCGFRNTGLELQAPGQMSASRWVFAAVPSVIHNSRP